MTSKTTIFVLITLVVTTAIFGAVNGWAFAGLYYSVDGMTFRAIVAILTDIAALIVTIIAAKNLD
jgi:hypothetical protein